MGDLSEGPRILCVEDNKDSREMLKHLLTLADERYSITVVETAAEALALMGRNSFDLYVLDLWLPGMDGMELCRRIRERDKDVPIVFFSAMVRPADRKYLLSAGATEYLEKPKDIDKFVPTIQRLLGEEESLQAGK